MAKKKSKKKKDDLSQPERDLIILCELRKREGFRCQTCVHWVKPPGKCTHENFLTGYYKKTGITPPSGIKV